MLREEDLACFSPSRTLFAVFRVHTRMYSSMKRFCIKLVTSGSENHNYSPSYFTAAAVSDTSFEGVSVVYSPDVEGRGDCSCIVPRTVDPKVYLRETKHRNGSIVLECSKHDFTVPSREGRSGQCDVREQAFVHTMRELRSDDLLMLACSTLIEEPSRRRAPRQAFGLEGLKVYAQLRAHNPPPRMSGSTLCCIKSKFLCSKLH